MLIIYSVIRGSHAKTILISFFLIFFAVNIFTQNKYEYKVMTSSGQVEFSATSKTSNVWQSLKTGAILVRANIVKITDGYLCLLHKSGSTIELSGSRTYKVTEINKLLKHDNPDIKKKIANFVYDKITEKPISNENDNVFNPVGGVERDVKLPVINDNKLRQIYPKNSKIIDVQIPFCWTSGGHTNFTLTIKDKFDKQIFTADTKDTTLTVNMKDMNLQPGTCYYWDIKSGNTITKQFCLLPVFEKEINEIKKGADKLIKYCNPDSPVDNIILATYYAEKKVAYRAAEFYRRAIKLAPRVQEYINLYNNYISIKSEE